MNRGNKGHSERDDNLKYIKSLRTSGSTVNEILQYSHSLIYPNLRISIGSASTLKRVRSLIVLERKDGTELEFSRAHKNNQHSSDSFTLDGTFWDRAEFINPIVQRMMLLGHVIAAKKMLSSALQSLENDIVKSEKPTRIEKSRKSNVVMEFISNLIEYFIENFPTWVESLEEWINRRPKRIHTFVFGILLIGSGIWLFDRQIIPISGYKLEAPDWFTGIFIGYLLFIGFVYFLIALDLQTTKQKNSIQAHENFHRKLLKIQSSLVQVNLSVLSNNRYIDPSHISAETLLFTPEGFIRMVEEELNTKDSVSSIMSIITARIKVIDTVIKNYHQEQQKSRRKIMAAGGAFFISFALYEIIESVAHHNHLKEGKDTNSLLHHLLENKSQSANTLQQPDNFETEFHAADLSSSAFVLFITLLLTIVVMLLSFKNASSETDSAHKHHE